MSDPTKLNIGDVVVGTSDPSKSVYDSNGRKIREGVAFVGSEKDVEELRESIIRSAAAAGGKISPLKKTGKKAKKPVKNKTLSGRAYPTEPTYVPLNEPEPIQPPSMWEGSQEENIPVELETVSFENDFGKIRAKVETVIEHEMAFLLLFSNEDDITFEPKVGETLQFIRRSGYRFEVYYPGVIFSWTDGVKKAMILFKTDNSNG